MANKKDYKMYQEIREQPTVIGQLIVKYIDGARVNMPELDTCTDSLKKVKRLLFLGCGTSYHASIYGNYLAEELLSLPCEFEFADEFIARKAVIEKNTAVVILSQSGETADALKALKKARQSEALIIAVTNNDKSKLSLAADAVLFTDAGEEEAIAATKSFTGQLFMLALFVLYLYQQRQGADAASRKLVKEIKVLPKKLTEILQADQEIKKLAATHKKNLNFVFLGEKWNYPIAIEGALKLTETNSLEVEGFPTGEFRHGPIGMVKKSFPVIFVAPNDRTYKKNLEVMKEVKKAGGQIILITTAGKKEKSADHILYIPKTLEALSPFLSVMPLQLFAFYLAIAKGIAVDKPANLSKYVK